MVSRIDRADWKETMAKTHVNGMKWVNALGEGSAEDYYRRCISRDIGCRHQPVCSEIRPRRERARRTAERNSFRSVNDNKYLNRQQLEANGKLERRLATQKRWGLCK
ncbi:hypothetical protein GH714_044136 [Hevea brasiliensis]|uniref:Uncharacterized protein n=1 Tax=Hevea brasiliensis TaxID=3981 RepID=A0A6A6K0G7_HEVBR|nr:hypothetical protein GH714_044136 [Hevea brasiliensis]